MSKEKQTWNSKFAYVWSMIGSAVGFANILGFGSKCYKNGGAAFLIPLMVAVVTLGVPMLILEGILGKRYQRPLVGAFGMVLGRWGKMLAWPTVLGVTTIGGYYCVLNAWSLAYFGHAVLGNIPENTQDFFLNSFLGVTPSIGVWGGFSWTIGVISLLVLLFSYKVNVRNISDGIGKLSIVFIPLLMIILTVMFVSVVFLPGSLEGMSYFLIPHFESLKSPSIWLASYGHIFFSLSIGLAIIIGYSRYTDEKINIVRSMIWVAAGDLVTSFLAGLVIFGGLGHMSLVDNVPFAEVAATSSFGLGFIVFPKVMMTFSPWMAKFVGGLFFFCLFLAGFTGLISIIEAVSGNFEEEFSWSRHKAVGLTASIMGVLAIIFSFGNGAGLIDVVDSMTAGINVLLSGLFHIVCFLFISKEIKTLSVWYIGKRKGFYYYTLKYISPVAIVSILVPQLYSDFWKNAWDIHSTIKWGWFVCAIILSFLFVKYLQNTDQDNLTIN